jgi:hypothetical protein
MRARVKTEVPVNYNPETLAMENSCGTGLLLKCKFISVSHCQRLFSREFHHLLALAIYHHEASMRFVVT